MLRFLALLMVFVTAGSLQAEDVEISVPDSGFSLSVMRRDGSGSQRQLRRGFKAAVGTAYALAVSCEPWELRHLPEIIKLNESVPVYAFRVGYGPGMSLSSKHFALICKMTELRKLDLGAAPGVSDGTFAGVSQLEHLEELEIELAPISDEAIKTLAGLSELKSLRLEDMPKLTDQGIANLVGLKHLEQLTLKDMPNVGAETNKALGKLKQISECTVIESHDVNRLLPLLRDNTTITSLELDGAGDDVAATITAIASMRALTSLRLSHDPRLTDNQLKALADMPQLRNLELPNCSEVRGHTLDAFAGRSLERITLWGCQLDAVGLRQLRLLTSLKHLAIGPDIQGDGADFLELVSLTSLHSLQVQSACFDDRSMAILASLPILRSLSLRDCAITSAGLAYLESVPELTDLCLEGCTSVGDKGLVHVAKLTALDRLNLATTGTTGVGMARLASLIHLQSLDLCHTRVTNAALKALVDLPIEHLYLYGCPNLTDACHEMLDQMKRLQWVDLRNSVGFTVHWTKDSVVVWSDLDGKDEVNEDPGAEPTPIPEPPRPADPPEKGES